MFPDQFGVFGCIDPNRAASVGLMAVMSVLGTSSGGFAHQHAVYVLTFAFAYRHIFALRFPVQAAWGSI